MRFPFTRYGYRELTIFSLVFGLLTVIALLLLWPLAVIPFALLCFTASFFRDPERRIPDGPGQVVSPADGVVTDITEIDDCEYISGPATRIGIFLSVFNVHVNRAPCTGQIGYIKYHPGRFLNAMGERASKENEANSVGMHLPDYADKRILVKQISGAIARRIVCDCHVGDSLARGQRFGMIKFGSRTELYIPRDLPFDTAVAVGDKVKGGLTILGTIQAP